MIRVLTVCLSVLSSGVVAQTAADQTSPNELLRDIGEALEQVSYQGTLIRSVDGKIDTMHVLHSNDDGVIREKLVSMDGEGREVLRNGDELICLLPQQKVKLIDNNVSPSNAFVRLPMVINELGNFYVLESKGMDRVAGRTARRFFIKPQDAFRYGHRLWVDEETLLPLRMQLVSRTRIIEEIRFAAITIGEEIPASLFASDIDSSDFRVIRAAASMEKDQRSTQISLAEAPGDSDIDNWPREPSPGFRLRATQSQMVTINGRTAQRLVFSDGLATVSVFITTQPAAENDPVSKVSRMGAASSYQRRIGDQLVTLVGEVPIETLKLLAERTEQQILARQQQRREQARSIE
ncbi:MAG: MucB/RseB C-terminal domain-containing protein [Pseudomonadota bacterium]